MLLAVTEDQIVDLIATLRNIEFQYIEWRRTFRAGTKRRQEVQQAWEHEARLIRIYEPLLIPGILHTAAYAAKIVRTAVSFYGIPDDVELVASSLPSEAQEKTSFLSLFGGKLALAEAFNKSSDGLARSAALHDAPGMVAGAIETQRRQRVYCRLDLGDALG